MVDASRLARMKQKAWSMLDANRPQEALAAFRECIEMQPEQPTHLVELGVALYKLKRLDESLKVFDEALAMDPKFLLAINNKARIFIDQGKDAEALAQYREILNIDPKHIRTWVKAAQLMTELGRFEKAEGCILEALAISPEDYNLWRERAVIARMAKQFDVALAHIDTALGFKARVFESLHERANILAALGRFEEAIEAYKTALREDNRDIKVKIALAYVYLAAQKPSEALDAFEAAFIEDKNSPTIWEGRGLAFVALGQVGRGLVNRATAAMIEKRYDDALEIFDEAIAAEPKYPEAWSNKGVLLEKRGEYEAAAKAYAQALELDPNAVICMHNLGMIYIERLDRRKEGLKLLKTTLKYDPQRWFKLPAELRSAVDSVPFND